MKAALLNRLAQPDETRVDLAVLQCAELIATRHVEKVDGHRRERALERGERDREQVVE